MLYGLDDVAKLRSLLARAEVASERQRRSSGRSWRLCSATARPRAAGARCCSAISARNWPTLRQLRRLPGAPGELRRHGAGPEGALRRLPHRPALRRRPPDRRAARRAERAGGAPRARPPVGVRGRPRPRPRGLALRAAPARRPGVWSRSTSRAMAASRSPATAARCSRASGGVVAPRSYARPRARSRQDRSPAGRHGPGPRTEALFQRLRQWRLETAARRSVPPYVIFHDATLLAIAQARPRSRHALDGLPGVGATPSSSATATRCSR